MGAPGQYFVCEKGHIFYGIEKGLVWDEELWEEVRRIQEGGCPCGAKTQAVVNHYGSISDCEYWKEDGEETILVEIDFQYSTRMVKRSNKFSTDT